MEAMYFAKNMKENKIKQNKKRTVSNVLDLLKTSVAVLIYLYISHTTLLQPRSAEEHL